MKKQKFQTPRVVNLEDDQPNLDIPPDEVPPKTNLLITKKSNFFEFFVLEFFS